MKKYLILISIAVIITCLVSCKNRELYHSFHPDEIWKDNNGVHINAHGGGILYHKGIYYWYGEHKIATKLGNRAQVGVHCYSSKDLYNWIDMGIVLKVVENDPQHDIAKGCILERPKVIYNQTTKKFVMWFHLELKGRGYSSARSGIAIADNPTGQFRFIKSVRPNKQQWPVNVLDCHKNPVDGRYIWLPIKIEDDSLKLNWYDMWNLDYFDQ